MSELHNSQSYAMERPDILKFINDAHNVLDVGCNEGVVARQIKRKFPNAKIWGIEIIPEILELAKKDLEKGWVIDLDNLKDLDEKLGDLNFDVIVCGDVLEHTWKIEEITSILYEKLKPGGGIFISVPNYGHWHIITAYIKQKWPRNERGIFDKTHKKIIMKGNLKEFGNKCTNHTFKLLKRNYRFFESNKYWKISFILGIILFPIIRLPYLNNFFTHSFIFRITKPQI